MRYQIHIDPAYEEPLVEITCRQVAGEVEGILRGLALTETTVLGQGDDGDSFFPLREVLYFESVEDRTFLYTATHTYECPLRLYQLEERLGQTGFVRISKSVVASLWHMRSLRREKNRTLTAVLSNGECVRVSRTYLADIQRKLAERSIGGKDGMR